MEEPVMSENTDGTIEGKRFPPDIFAAPWFQGGMPLLPSLLKLRLLGLGRHA
jgi:hypothetical protein